MVKLISPAPGGSRGLAYGNTTVPPYNSARPHRGQDWEREWRSLDKPRPVVASAGGRVTSVYSGSGKNQGWGRRVEITVPSVSHHIVVALNHLETVAVTAGSQIPAGGYVGEMGNSGEAFGVHLHEELWINGVRVDPNPYRTRDLPGTIAGSAASGGTDARPFNPEEDDDMYDAKAEERDAERLAATEKRLMDKMQEIHRAAAPIKLLSYGTGVVAVNPLNGRFTILSAGYPELYVAAGLGAPSVGVDDGEFSYITGMVPRFFGDLDAEGRGAGLSDEDLTQIKAAIDANRVALSQDQYDRLIAAVTQGARSGGETGARKALEDLTLVVKTG